MEKYIIIFLFIVTAHSMESTRLANTITITEEQSLEVVYKKNYKQNRASDSCWDSFVKINSDLSLDQTLDVGTIIYLPSNSDCKEISTTQVLYIPQVVLPFETLKDPTKKKSILAKFKESYRFGSEVSYSYVSLDGTNSSNNSSLQLLSQSSYSIKVINEFTIPNWIAKINFKYKRTKFKKLPSTEIIGNDFRQSRIELLLARKKSTRFSFGLYQEFGEGLLHEGSGASLKLIKTQKWMGAIQADYSVYKGKSINFNINGFAGHSVVTADEKRKTSGGLHYLGQLSLQKSMKNASINVGVFHRFESEENGIYKQELNNSGITFGVKLDF